MTKRVFSFAILVCAALLLVGSLANCACPRNAGNAATRMEPSEAQRSLAVARFVALVLADDSLKGEAQPMPGSDETQIWLVGVESSAFEGNPQAFHAVEEESGNVRITPWVRGADKQDAFDFRISVRRMDFVTLFVCAFGTEGSQSGVETVWVSEDGKVFRYLYRDTP